MQLCMFTYCKYCSIVNISTRASHSAGSSMRKGM